MIFKKLSSGTLKGKLGSCDSVFLLFPLGVACVSLQSPKDQWVHISILKTAHIKTDTTVLHSPQMIRNSLFFYLLCTRITSAEEMGSLGMLAPETLSTFSDPTCSPDLIIPDAVLIWYHIKFYELHIKKMSHSYSCEIFSLLRSENSQILGN